MQVFRCQFDNPADGQRKEVVVKSIDLPHTAVDNCKQVIS